MLLIIIISRQILHYHIYLFMGNVIKAIENDKAEKKKKGGNYHD
jgi:hypothetical protein